MAADLLIQNARVPAALLAAPAGEGELPRLDLEIRHGRIAAIRPAGSAPIAADLGVIDQDEGQVWPGLVDLHTHLDKGHIWPRAENPDGSFTGALHAVEADRSANWSAEDVRRRFEFGLRCAHAHGTVAIRTHLDSIPPQQEISWPLFEEIRTEWADRITLQAVSLLSIDLIAPPLAEAIADRVAAARGILGAVTYMVPDLDQRLDLVFRLAAERGLELDFHVDETEDPAAVSLGRIARAALRHEFPHRITCGHCCSLARQPSVAVAETIALVRGAGIAVVSLPMCNLYLQDRAAGRTPRWRGVTLLHELRAAGVPVAVASDNCRDPFYGYGDLDLVEVFREAVRIAHLDRPLGDWPLAVTGTPAEVMGLAGRGRIAVGGSADLVLFRARQPSELLARPQTDRIVLRAGRPIDRPLPDYRELDDLFR
jgi:cytosine deaminase